MNRRILWVASFVLVACAQTPPNTANFSKTKYQEQLWQKVAREVDIETSKTRTPAAQESLASKMGLQIGDFRSQNKSFEMYVFPKIRQMAAMNSLPLDQVFLGKPVRMSVHVPYASTCSFLKNGFEELHGKKYFPSELVNGSQSCVILEITNTKLQDLPRPLVKEGDELRKRMYLDDQFRVYGIEADFYIRVDGQLELKTASLKYNGTESSTSGTSFIPSEMIVMSSVESMGPFSAKELFDDRIQTAKSLGYNYPQDRTLIDAIALKQIKKLNKKFIPPSCNLQKISYKDLLGIPGRMFWCHGSIWPSVVDSGNFVAVTGLAK